MQKVRPQEYWIEEELLQKIIKIFYGNIYQKLGKPMLWELVDSLYLLALASLADSKTL